MVDPETGTKWIGFDGDAKKVTQQIEHLLQAQWCLSQNQGCPLEVCRETKNLIRHLEICQKASFCKVPKCYWAKVNLRHFKMCTNENCQVCQPIKSLI